MINDVVFTQSTNDTEGQIFTASSDGSAKVWDVRSGQCVRSFQDMENRTCFSVSHSRSMLVACSFNEEIHVFDIR